MDVLNDVLFGAVVADGFSHLDEELEDFLIGKAVEWARQAIDSGRIGQVGVA